MLRRGRQRRNECGWVIYPIGEQARGAYSGAQWFLRLRSPEKDSGSGDQSVVESLHEFSYDRTLHVARLDIPRKLDPHDFGARATLRAVSGLVLAAQSCREDQDPDVKWGRGWLSGGGLAGGEGGHHPDPKGCITHAAPASRVHHLHHDGSPASDLHHLHQPSITCINPASPASSLHHAQKAASTLHQPRTG